MSPDASLLMMVATLLMVVAGTTKKRLVWRPKPLRVPLRRKR